MIPGEIVCKDGTLTLNEGRETLNLVVANTGDRPIQVGSHYHFYETNTALDFDREAAKGYRLDIPAGTAVRFEPGQTRDQERDETDAACRPAVTSAHRTSSARRPLCGLASGRTPRRQDVGSRLW